MDCGYYLSNLGKITLLSDGVALTGLYFEQQLSQAKILRTDCVEKNLPVFDLTRRWLDLYFAGKIPDFMPEIRFHGTPFQMEVWSILRTIPYGKTVTYQSIAQHIATAHGKKQMSAQAVGGAVGRNPVSVIVPCHRVIGTSGKLVGYAGGLDLKSSLLSLEKWGVDFF